MTSYSHWTTQCPHCEIKFATTSVASCNTIQARFYTDGYVEGPMYDPGSPLVTCPRCQSHLWVDELTAIESSEESAVSQSDGQSSVAYAESVHGGQYEDLLRQKLWSNIKQEYFIRSRAWWAHNDKYRSEGSPVFELSSEQQVNLERLLMILGSNSSGAVLMKAEILRELGRFDESLELLKLPLDEDHLPSRDDIARLAKAGKAAVAEYGEDYRGCHEFFVRQADEDKTHESEDSPARYTEIHPNSMLPVGKFLSRFGLHPWRFCALFDTENRREGRWPWAVIFLEREYRLAGHVAALRQDRSDFSFSAFSMSFNHSSEEKAVPPVGILIVYKKAALETASMNSELFRKAWVQLENKSEDRHWICIPEPPSEEWINKAEANDDDLFMTIYQKRNNG